MKLTVLARRLLTGYAFSLLCLPVDPGLYLGELPRIYMPARLAGFVGFIAGRYGNKRLR